MVNIFKSIEEGPRGPAFIPSCELAYRFMKIERANAEDLEPQLELFGINQMVNFYAF